MASGRTGPRWRIGVAALALAVGGAGAVAHAIVPTVDAPASVAQGASRVGPPITFAPPGSDVCPPTGRAAVIDRDAQRAWLCTDGLAGAWFPITTALDQPLPATYHVYAKTRVATSWFGGHLSYLDNFVAFARGIHTGARVAFHAVPRTAGGAPYQPYDAVGTPAWHGASSGCIRVLPSQSVVIWSHLAIGDPVIVVT